MVYGTIPAVGDSFSFVFVGTGKILSACKYFSGELELLTPIEPTETNPRSEGPNFYQRRNGPETCTDALPISLSQGALWNAITLSIRKLLERFKRVKYAVSSNTNRPNQCCIEFLKDNGHRRGGHRLAVVPTRRQLW